MTVSRAHRLIEKSVFTIESFKPIPIKRVRRIARWLPREFFTSIVRCALIPAGARQAGREFVGSAAPGRRVITAGSMRNR